MDSTITRSMNAHS